MTISTALPNYILTLSCDDVAGIVAAVSHYVTENGGNIIESAQFGDASTGRFFLRMEFQLHKMIGEDVFQKAFHDKVADRFAMRWQLNRTDRKPRLLIMVSKFGHCLNDLLHRWHSGTLAVEIPAIISNHEEMREVANWYNVPYYHFPLGKGEGAKAAQEAKVKEVIQRHQIDLTVLARYMQILSPDLCQFLSGKAINIHHSFLPSFKGARPYHQAFERGVKIIGATAHYVTSDLDEGPIIEQEVTRVDHSLKPVQLTAAGRDIECLVLARAVNYHIEHRVLQNDGKTVVFR